MRVIKEPRAKRPRRKVRVCVDLPEDAYRAYVREGRRRGVSAEALVEQVLQGLLRELERDEERGTDHPISPS